MLSPRGAWVELFRRDGMNLNPRPRVPRVMRTMAKGGREGVLVVIVMVEGDF